MTMTDQSPAAAMRPAYLGDARLGDTIAFRLPATGGIEAFTGRLTAFERIGHAARATAIAFTLAGNDRVFTCRPDLHIDLAAA